MSIYQSQAAPLLTERVRLAGTGATTIVSGGDNGTAVDAIHVANTGTGTPDITIDCHDGTTAHVLLQEHTLAAKSTESGGLPLSTYGWQFPFRLPANWTVRVTSSVGGNAVHVTATHVKPPGRS